MYDVNIRQNQLEAEAFLPPGELRVMSDIKPDNALEIGEMALMAVNRLPDFMAEGSVYVGNDTGASDLPTLRGVPIELRELVARTKGRQAQAINHFGAKPDRTTAKLDIISGTIARKGSLLRTGKPRSMSSTLPLIGLSMLRTEDGTEELLQPGDRVDAHTDLAGLPTYGLEPRAPDLLALFVRTTYTRP